jgi:predicted ATPase
VKHRVERVHIQNFRCLREACVELGPLTALVGPNAVGKTAILTALDPWRELEESDRWMHRAEVTTRVVLEFEDGRTIDRSMHAEAREEKREVAPPTYQRVHLDVTHLRTRNFLAAASQLKENGSNLVNVFYGLGRQRQVDVARRLAGLIPTLADVDLVPVATGQHALEFTDRWNPEVRYSAHEVSDGTLLTLAYLVLQHQEEPVDLLCIEEPERGLHPYLLAQLVDFLRRTAHGETGPQPLQVVIATHSPEVLDALRPEEVRFLRRDPDDGAVVVEAAPRETSEWRQAFDEYRESLGSLWLAGGLGGVPGR